MVSLVGRWRGSAVGSNSTAGGAPGAVAADAVGALLYDRRDARYDAVAASNPIWTHDRLVQATSEFDSGQVTPGTVYGIVVPGWQEKRTRVVVCVATT